jgi:hypothetical protein
MRRAFPPQLAPQLERRYVELRDKPEVDEGDFLMPVPDAGASAFLL